MIGKGIYAWYGYDLPQQEALQKMVEAGFDTTTIWWSDDFFSKEKTLTLARDLGLQVVSGHLPFERINDLWIEDADDAFLDELCSLIADAGKASLPILVIHPSKGPTPPAINSRGLARFSRLLETAEAHGVSLALENTRSRIHFDHLLQTFPELRICYDSGHNHAVTKDPDLLAPYTDRLIAIHLHDNDGVFDLHQLPFEGSIDWPKEMRMLAQTSYAGSIMLESISDGTRSPDDYLRACVKAIEKLQSFY